ARLGPMTPVPPCPPGVSLPSTRTGRIPRSALAARLAAAGLHASTPDAAVVSVRAPGPEAAVAWAADCRRAGLAVGCFRPPSVPDGVSRLRLTARGDLTDAQIADAVRIIASLAPAGATA
ncbi:aminotransferase class I/II-fold pyridoxal phosphate-dependent enzyme, partial [Kitasatospora sp. NPDC047058]|uniref:aminotransferase class I/II-fold pyridoxal phosphate-dependent enzyme n=1 Tax=Kitasatospora sp. NPDC047058 TaxID=3155620 RepID=UPI0033DD8CCA